MKKPDEAVRFAILIYDGVEPIDIGGTYGVFSMAKRILPGIDMFIVAEKPGPTRLAGGLQVEAHHGLDDCPPADVLIVCGGPGWRDVVTNDRVLTFIRSWTSRGVVSSVCTGGLILAEAGVLAGRPATTRRHAVGAEEEAPLRRMGKLYPSVKAVEALIVDDGAVVTGGGVSLAIDTTLHLLGRFYGAAAASQVADIIEYNVAWQANMAAFKRHEAEVG